MTDSAYIACSPGEGKRLSGIGNQSSVIKIGENIGENRHQPRQPVIANSRMSATLSLIPELEQVVQHGTREKRVETLQRITSLFLDGASTYNDEHVDLFDDVFGLLIEEIESKVRAELSSRLAPVTNAPVKVLRTLAKDDDIAVAGPVLELARALPEADLVDVAKTKSQAHLQAISARRVLGEAVTDVLVRTRRPRGGAPRRGKPRRPHLRVRLFPLGQARRRRRRSGGNSRTAAGYSSADVPRVCCTRATAVVHKRLLASASPEAKADIHDVLAKVANEVGARVGPRDYGAAQRVVLSLSRAGRMNEAALLALLQRRQI